MPFSAKKAFITTGIQKKEATKDLFSYIALNYRLIISQLYYHPPPHTLC